MIPPASGAASALGFLAAPLSFEQVAQRIRCALDAPDSTRRPIDAILRELEAEAARRLRAAGVADADASRRALRRHAPGRPDARDQRAAARRARSPTRAMPAIRAGVRRAPMPRAIPPSMRGADIEAVSFRVRCRGPLPRLSLHARPARGRAGAARKGTRAGLVRRRLRRYAGLRPLCAGARRAHRRPGDHRGARGDHGHPARRHGHRRCRRQPAHRRRAWPRAPRRASTAGHAARAGSAR